MSAKCINVNYLKCLWSFTWDKGYIEIVSWVCLLDFTYYKYYVFPNCKSLWIKASAKCLNVNVNVNY